MHLPKVNPEALVGAPGARKTDLLASAISSDITPSPHLLQAAKLQHRFGWTDERSRVVAELAFGVTR